MSRKTFAALFQKYQSGNATEEERKVVEQWYALLDEKPRTLNAKEWQELEKRLWNNLQINALGREPAPGGRTVSLWSNTVFKMGIAAAIALLVVVGFLSYRNDTSEPSQKSPLASKIDADNVIANTTHKVLSVILEDSSRVSLNPGSKLRYPIHFSVERREVLLTGEAFFEVSENPERPFLVNAGDITTKVLGTSFRVKALPNVPSVEVSVLTGKVSVYQRAKENNDPSTSNKQGNGVVLSPNHRVVFSEGNGLFLTSLVENPVPLPIQQAANSFDFDDTPLDDVLDHLETTYSIDITLDRKTLGACPLTARLSGMKLYEQLDVICAAIQGSYEIKGTTILISGRGCESSL